MGQYLDAWLRDSVAGTVARHTQRDYEDKVRLHLKPALGKARFADLTTQHLNRLYRKKLAEGQSPRSVRYMHTTMSKALHEAEGADLVRKNVARWAKPPKDEHEEKPVLSVADAMLFLEAIRGDRMEALYLLAVTTGLRRDDRAQVAGPRPRQGHAEGQPLPGSALRLRAGERAEEGGVEAPGRTARPGRGSARGAPGGPAGREESGGRRVAGRATCSPPASGRRSAGTTSSPAP